MSALKKFFPVLVIFVIIFNVSLLVELSFSAQSIILNVLLLVELSFSAQSINLKKKLFLYSAISSPLDRSKRFTLFASAGRPVHSDTNSASPGSILTRQQLRAKAKSLTFLPLSTARYPTAEILANATVITSLNCTAIVMEKRTVFSSQHATESVNYIITPGSMPAAGPSIKYNVAWIDSPKKDFFQFGVRACADASLLISNRRVRMHQLTKT